MDPIEDLRMVRRDGGTHLPKSKGTPGYDRDLQQTDDGNGTRGPTESRPATYDDIVAAMPEVFNGDPARSDASGAEGGAELAVVGGLALVGLTVAAVSTVAAVASSLHSRKERRRELEWRIAEARRDIAQVVIASHRVAAPAGWYDDGSGQLRWWDGQEWTEHYYTVSPRVAAPAGWYDDGSGRLKWWDGHDWTEHYEGSQPGDQQSRDWMAALGGAYSSDLERGQGLPTMSMSRAQWTERFRAMLQARTVSELQWRLLSNARIEDADSDLQQWQAQLRTFTAQQFSRGIDRYVASQPEQALQLATAGWYDDGSGSQRWWDGLEWTGYVQTDDSRMLLPGR